MSRFAPLFRVDVGHSFFADGFSRGTDLLPDGPSRALMQRAGLVARMGPGRLEVFYDVGMLRTLELFSSDPEEPFRLDLRLITRDPSFWDYTEGGPFRDNILAFDSRSASTDPQDGTLRLSKEEVVSAPDLVSLASDRVAGMLEGRDLVAPPVALVRVELADGSGVFRVPPDSGGGWVYTLRFAARRTYWRYLLLGRLAGNGATILDPDGVAQFEWVGEEILPGDRKASSFRSTTRIPLEEFSSRRFQLRGSGGNSAGNGRILIKRLPVAGTSAARRETIEGESALVSDILVNG